MKIISFELPVLEGKGELALTSIPDTTLLRNNDDFYVPNFSTQLQAQAGIYVSIQKIGKHIEVQFIERYIKEVGLAVHIIAVDAFKNCMQQNVPTDICRGFDHSLAVSKQMLSFTQVQNSDLDIEFIINQNNTQTHTIQWQTIYNLISQATEFYTLKIGDICFIPFFSFDFAKSEKVTFEMCMQGQHFLHCGVK